MEREAEARLCAALVLPERVQLVDLPPAGQGIGLGGLEQREEAIVREEREVDVMAPGQEVEAGVDDVIGGRLREDAAESPPAVGRLRGVFAPKLEFVVPAGGSEELAE